jgi:orotidine-5'-phosphate decarboxylase
MRHGDQEQSSFWGTDHSLEASQVPVTRTSREPVPAEASSTPDEQEKNGETRLTEQGEPRPVAHQRHVSPWRASLRRPGSLRTLPSLARFLRAAGPGDTRAGQGPRADRDADPAGAVEADGDVEAVRGVKAVRGVEAGRNAAGKHAETVQDVAAARAPTQEGRAPESRAPESRAPESRAREGRAQEGLARESRAPESRAQEGLARESRARESRARESRARESGAPESSAAELRELAELSDLLAELAGLVHDLGALIIGLVTAATGAGDRQVRAFTIPPELAELATGHQELKAEQRALSARFRAAGSHQERVALRGSLAALTERATRAVAAAAAAVTPRDPLAPEGGAGDQGPGPGSGREPDTSRASGTPSSEGTPSPGESWSLSREETGVQTPPGGTPPRTPGDPVQGMGAGVPDKPRLAPVAVALDAPDIDVAAHWATLVTPYVSTVMIGLELYLRYGPTVVATVRGGSGVRVFLDLKLHDIPNTVAGAARAVAKLRPEILSVHATGGADMIRAAVEAAPDTIVAGVTLLTSIGDKDLIALGIDGSVSDAVRRMATLAVSAGARGLVCSPQEVAAVRAEVGPDILLITPGIRLVGATSDDQARVATPEEALKAGADLLVIGRPITKSPDPGAAAVAIAASLRRAVLARGGTVTAGGRPPCTPRHGRASPLHIPPTGGRRQKRGALRAVAGVRAPWLRLAGGAEPVLPGAVAVVRAPWPRLAGGAEPALSRVVAGVGSCGCCGWGQGPVVAVGRCANTAAPAVAPRGFSPVSRSGWRAGGAAVTLASDVSLDRRCVRRNKLYLRRFIAGTL